MATTKVSKGLIKDGAVTIEKLNSALVVTEAEGIPNNDNDVTVPTSAAVKGYVDSVVVGGLVYQGAYDAATNTPVLDSRGTQVSVNQGWTYTVTVNGTFYGETVKVGDVLIAETDLAAGTGALTDWTTVQSNIDLATAGTDATAVRGLAGFDTDDFTVANGFVNLKATGTTYDYSSIQSGDDVDLNLTPSTGAVDTVKLVAGTGMALTDDGSNNVTIDYTGSSIQSRVVDTFNIANTTTNDLTLTAIPFSKSYVDLYVSGVYQSKTLYSVLNNVLTFTAGFFPNGSLVETITIGSNINLVISADSTAVTSDDTTITADQLKSKLIKKTKNNGTTSN